MFCLKNCGEGESSGVQAHEVKKISPDLNFFYLKENDSRAFIKPVLTSPVLSLTVT
jgi:hypothetical protein